MTFKLRKLSVSDGRDIYNMLQHIGKNENGFINHCQGMDYASFKGWLMRSEEISRGKDLEDWKVPQNIYWLYADNLPVGMAKLRHKLTKSLEIEGGHIGYAIALPYRNKGYCTKIISLVLSEASKLGIEQALITVKNSNKPSIKAAINNGGVIEKIENDRHYIWLETS